MTKKKEVAILREHALLSPSSASRWTNCPQSVTLSKDVPETINDAATEGTRLHEIAEKTLKAYFEKGELLEYPDNLHTYINYIKQEVSFWQLVSDANVHLEDRLTQGFPIAKEFEIRGTADCVIECEDHLIVIDYKSGFNPVDPEENLQLAIYGWLASLKYKKPVTRLVIVQRDAIKEWEVDAKWLDKTLEEILDVQTLLMQGLGQTRAGSWCQYCPVKYSCRAYMNSVSPVVSQLPNPREVNNEELAKVFSITNFLADYIKAVNVEVNDRALKQNQSLPGFKVIKGKGRRAWKLSEEEVLEALKKKGYKVGDVTDKKLKSFTQIEKLDSKAKELVTTLVKKSEGSCKVVTNETPGDAITLGGDSLPGIEN
jgi:CRISPR/Cas system-associated exonuclease Cas4 (RecB family)